jgi:hypothetical protein
LKKLAREWRTTFHAPPGLEDRVRKALTDPVVPLPKRRPSRRPWLWATAATLALALAGWAWLRPLPQAPQVSQRLLAEKALRHAQDVEQAHAEAIAQLELAAGPILAGVLNPELSGQEAALILSYRDRLAYLDRAILEVREYVDRNPGHPGARTVLLAAYKEKTEVLRHLIVLEEKS